MPSNLEEVNRKVLSKTFEVQRNKKKIQWPWRTQIQNVSWKFISSLSNFKRIQQKWIGIKIYWSGFINVHASLCTKQPSKKKIKRKRIKKDRHWINGLTFLLRMMMIILINLKSFINLNKKIKRIQTHLIINKKWPKIQSWWSKKIDNLHKII